MRTIFSVSNPLIACLTKAEQLKPDSIQAILSVCERITFTKEAIIKEKGELCNSLYFLEKGVLACSQSPLTSTKRKRYRSFIDSGAVTKIIIENRLVLPAPLGKACQVTIQAIEKGSLLCIREEDLTSIATDDPAIITAYQNLLMQELWLENQTLHQFRIQKSRGRFFTWIKSEEGKRLFGDAIQKYIASYLCMPTETYSRFKSLLQNQKNN